MTSKVAVRPKRPGYDRTSGRVTGRVKKPASFRGRHNRNRALVLLTLDEYHSQHHGRGKGLSVRQLADMTGLSINSLFAGVGNWTKWHFIGRYYGKDKRGRVIYHYRILKKGRRWLEKHLPFMPLERYLADLQNTQNPSQVV